MWTVSQAEATEMYARYFEARHRSAAGKRARETARALKSKGDPRGERAWIDVAETIERHARERQAAPRPLS